MLEIFLWAAVLQLELDCLKISWKYMSSRRLNANLPGSKTYLDRMVYQQLIYIAINIENSLWEKHVGD